MKSLVLCGLFKFKHGCSDIYCDPSTGDVVLDDDINGCCLLSEVTVIDPKPITEEAMLRIIGSLDVCGVVTTDKYLITLTEDKAQYRLWESAHIVAHELNYDTDTVYEEGIN